MKTISFYSSIIYVRLWFGFAIDLKANKKFYWELRADITETRTANKANLIKIMQLTQVYEHFGVHELYPCAMCIQIVH